MVVSKKNIMEQKIIDSTHFAVTDLVRLAQYGNSRLWIDYDDEADVLYINFLKPQKADNAYQEKDGIIRRVRRNKIIGLTILNASRFTKNKSSH